MYVFEFGGFGAECHVHGLESRSSLGFELSMGFVDR